MVQAEKTTLTTSQTLGPTIRKTKRVQQVHSIANGIEKGGKQPAIIQIQQT